MKTGTDHKILAAFDAICDDEPDASTVYVIQKTSDVVGVPYSRVVKALRKSQ